MSSSVGLAYRVTTAGAVAEVLHHTLPIDPPDEGRLLIDLLDPGSAVKGLRFLRSVTEQGVSLGWELDVRTHEGSRRLAVGGVVDGRHLIVIGTDHGDLERFLSHIAGVNNDLTGRLRDALRDAAGRNVATELDDLSQLNNELTNLHRELARKSAELERLNERKNRMLGMAAHDLRNPLGAILGFAELLELRVADRMTESERSLLSRISESSRRMAGLVDDLLDVSAIESGTVQLDLQDVDVVSVVREVVEIERWEAERKGIEIALEAPTDAATVVADAAKLHQVVLNLLSNARKYSDPDSRIEVDVTATRDGIELAVRDHGQGIAADEVPTLFEPFGRASSRTTAGESSTGLGLAIVQRIVQAHGGTISVDTELGAGSTFTVSLPASRADG